MINRISNSQVEQKCSNCESLNMISVSSLKAGYSIVIETVCMVKDKNMVVLPTCSCGSTESLFRTWDNPGSERRL